MAARKPFSRRREFIYRIKNSFHQRMLKRFPSFSAPNASRLSVGVIAVGIGCAGCLTWCVQQVKEKRDFTLTLSCLRGFESGTGIFSDAVKCEAKNETSEKKAEKSMSRYVSAKCSATCRYCDHKKHETHKSLASAIEKAQSIMKQKKEECGSPGAVVAVSIDGRVVWKEGFGYSDVENNVQCTPETVMRIASISKPLTAAAVAQLWEQKKLDLDAPVQQYVPSFPEKSHGGVAVTLTTRHLLSHLGGIRHYNVAPNSQEEKSTSENSKQTTARLEENKVSKKESEERNSDAKKLGSEKSDSKHGKQKSEEKSSTEAEGKESLIKDHYKSVTEALSLFKDDPLTSEPGTKYLYTTFGWTLVSAVVEGATKKDFLTYMKKLFREIGMENTMEELNSRIIYNRARYYQRNKAGRLLNAPYVDNSYKWAGGGFISTVGDLLKFGNAMLYASQVGDLQDKSDCSTPNLLPGILQPSTVKEMWTVVPSTAGHVKSIDGDVGYGMGWAVHPDVQRFGSCRHAQEVICHSGGAVGASSILLIKPRNPTTQTLSEISTPRDQGHTTCDLSREIHLPPRGIVVAILVNMDRVGLQQTALALVECFEGVQPHS